MSNDQCPRPNEQNGSRYSLVIITAVRHLLPDYRSAGAIFLAIAQAGEADAAATQE